MGVDPKFIGEGYPDTDSDRRLPCSSRTFCECAAAVAVGSSQRFMDSRAVRGLLSTCGGFVRSQEFPERFGRKEILIATRQRFPFNGQRFVVGKARGTFNMRVEVFDQIVAHVIVERFTGRGIFVLQSDQPQLDLLFVPVSRACSCHT